MKRFFFCLQVVVLFLTVTLATAAQENGDSHPAGLTGLGIGQTLADFTLADLDGAPRSLAQLKGEKGMLLVFISTTCPCSNAYNERMDKIARDYKARGIAFIGINANAKESSADAKRHAAQKRFSFPVLKDKGNKLADVLGAQMTPESFLFDKGHKLIYRGRIDNSKIIDEVKTHDLRNALDAHLSGKPVEKPILKALGCAIQRVK